MKNKTLFILGIVTILILSAGITLAMFYYSHLFLSAKPALPPIDFAKLSQDQIIEAVAISQNAKLVNVYLGYKISGGKLIGAYNNVLPGIYRLGDVVDNDVYVIRNAGSTLDELWLIKNQKETKIFTNDFGNTYSIKVSPNENLIAIYNGNYQVILNRQSNTKTPFIFDDVALSDLGGLIIQLGWSPDSKYYWGMVQGDNMKQTLFRIDVTDNKVEKFTAPVAFADYDYQLNYKTGILAYSTFPHFYNPNDYANFLESGATVQLRAVNLLTKNDILITKSPAKMLNPAWIDDITVQYDNPLKSPVGQNKISFGVPADLFYDQQTKQKLMSQIEDWSLYQEITDQSDRFVGSGDCGNSEFNDFKVKAISGSMKLLMLNDALPLIITPNYNNWSNAKFLEFGNDNTSICAVAGHYPLQSYVDKLLWMGVCHEGAQAPTIECYIAEDVLNSYFNNKPQ